MSILMLNDQIIKINNKLILVYDFIPEVELYVSNENAYIGTDFNLYVSLINKGHDSPFDIYVSCDTDVSYYITGFTYLQQYGSWEWTMVDKFSTGGNKTINIEIFKNGVLVKDYNYEIFVDDVPSVDLVCLSMIPSVGSYIGNTVGITLTIKNNGELPAYNCRLNNTIGVYPLSYGGHATQSTYGQEGSYSTILPGDIQNKYNSYTLNIYRDAGGTNPVKLSITPTLEYTLDPANEQLRIITGPSYYYFHSV